MPSLFIQDELHLLKEELGALNGHYEGALNEFARSFGRKPDHLPKIIAATATIESYEHHINHLYLRAPRKYPSMGFKKVNLFMLQVHQLLKDVYIWGFCHIHVLKKK